MWAVWALMWLSGAWSIMSALGSPDPTTEQEVSVTVEGVEGDTAAVPCDLFPSDPKDRVNLILWYKDEDKDPIYSYDARMAVFTSERHHLKDLSLKGRVSFTPSPGEPIPHTLTLTRLLASDAGRYTCRVDFMLAQSTTRAALLRVVAPVDLLTITDGMGHPVPAVLPPVAEGGTLNLTCTAQGGRPSPKVSWWFGDAVIDDSWESVGAGIVSNTLVLTPLTRAQVHSVLTCKAATAPVAITTATVTIDMYLRPVSVTITGPAATGSVRAGDMLDLTCTARGSRPQPLITWYKGATIIRTENTNTKDAVTGVGGVSHVRVKVDRRDNGARITCRATNPDLPRHNLHEHIVINVTYSPEVELRMGAQLDGTVVKEGASLYLTCHVDANPPPHTLTFMHEDTEVRQDKAAGVMINVNNLVLSKVRKTQAGHYYCKATNSEGTGVSPPVNITVRYAPVCAEAKDVWAEPGSTVTARCRVNASPEDSISFSWVWVTSSYTRRVIPSHISSEGSASKVEFTVPRDNITELRSNNRMGALQCWAENSVGRQDTPCIVAVRKPALPSAPVNCSLTGAGREVVTVNCEPGDHPTMPQTYLLQIYETNTNKLYRNVTSRTPKFIVRGLTSGHDYMVYVSSHTSYGRSPYSLVEAFTFKTAENRSKDSMPPLSTIIMFVCGVGAIVVLVIIIITVIRLKLRKRSHKCVRRTATATDSEIPKNLISGDKKSPEAKEGPAGAGLTKPSLRATKTLPETKEVVPLQPIIRQPSKPLQPIIKENGRSDNGKSSQGRTVLFVEPPKTQTGILVNKNEVPRNTYDAYSGRRGQMKGPNGDVQHSVYGSRGSYSDSLHTLHPSRGGDSMGYVDREPPMSRYRSTLDDRGDGVDMLEPQYSPSSSNTLSRDSGYCSLRGTLRGSTGAIATSPYASREHSRDLIRDHSRDLGRDHPRDLSRDHSRDLTRDHSRDLVRDLSRDHSRDLNRDLSREHSRDHSRSHSRDLGRDHPRDLSRDLSRDHSRDLGRDHSRDLGRDHRELGRDLSRDFSRDMVRDHSRELSREISRDHSRDLGRDQGHVFTFPSRVNSNEYDSMITRSPPPASFMKKSPSVSASVGRHYDFPPRGSESGTYRSLPRPSKPRGTEAETLLKYRSLDRRFDLPFSGSLQRVEPDSGEETPPQQRRYSGSPRLRFADEKHFHVYHDKEKKQDGIDDMDESFV
ncbi:uncharacterized protein LOC122261794 isoform X4 [Penaeus japonicus]|uniref:uncharacterized protein LOC122261794 isoform X4 n=1 Tax=Penaeus japonicus TaxID=27405 RepID=UPI001C716678|nr:uncharacterized protein LOC122261794 isoform X4 [Penaeus japonicus]